MQSLLLNSVSFPVTHVNIIPYHFECDIFGAGTQTPNQHLGLHALILVVGSGSYQIRGNSFFVVVVIVFCLMNHPSAPFASEQVPAVHLSPVLAPLGSSLACRRDVSFAGTAEGEGLGNSCAPGLAPLQEQKILSLYSASSSSGRCIT